MNISAVFHTGFDFESYLQKLGDDGIRFASRYERITLPDALQDMLSQLSDPLKILVLSEPWCPDCVLHVPLLARMVKAGPSVQMMVFPRDQNEDLAERYALNGKRVIPAPIFMDKDFQEIGRWYERPAAVHMLLQQGDEEEQREARRKYLQGHFLDHAAEEIRQLLAPWAEKHS